MGKLYDQLATDVRFKEGLTACLNCGTCTAICPAAEFYNYQPRQIVDILQTKDDSQIEALLKSDLIWYCGECMSCVTRCPRNNAPGLLIMALPPPPGLPASSAAARAGRVPKSETRNPKPEGNPRSEI